MSRLLSASLLFALAAVLLAAADQPPPPKAADAAPSWLWLGPKAEPDQAAFFRKEITLAGGVSAAKLQAAGDDDMMIFINGREVVRQKGGDNIVFKDVREYFVTKDNPTGQGRHVVAVRVMNRRGAHAGLLARLSFESGPAKPSVVVTDASWHVSPKGGKDGEGRLWNEVNYDDKAWKPATVVGKLGDKPWEKVTEAALAQAGKAREPSATPPETLKVAKDFQVELLYSVPKDTEGSWVSMCVDPKGRLIVCDQYGGLYRVTPPPLGSKPEAIKIEKVPASIGDAQGLLWAFDSLYVVVNSGKRPAGLYRVRDTDGDDQLDEVRLLRKLDGGGGEHGPHAVLLTPDGKSLVVVCGNQTKMTVLAGSRVPRCWGEDHLLPRMPDGRGFMRTVLGPGGCIYQVDPEGQNWELLSTGYRNQYDAAFNRHGDLFTYDADMEWDINTPWYRPTRVCLASSGSEFGWRNGAGKWPAYYPDNLPGVVDIGPGSPTGVTFGYGAKFPAKYQEAFFICDWSYGKLYAVHLTPEGSAYKGEFEEFVSGSPLPLTDLAISPADGAMYFAIGGRRTKSGLYRVTYAGKESTAPAKNDSSGEQARALRRKLESFHGKQDPAAADAAWPYLGHADRYLRFAARVAVEHQGPKTWSDRALAEKEPQAALSALLALVRVSASDPFHRPQDAPPVDEKLKADILEALGRLDWGKLTDGQRLDLLRVYGLVFNRMGKPDDAARQQIIARLDPHYPAKHRLLNGELCQLLVYLEAPGVATKTLPLLAEAPTQEEQMEYAKSLRMLKTGWSMEQRKEYFSWFLKAAKFKGGNSFTGFMRNIKDDAVATLADAEKAELKPILEAKVEATPLVNAKPRPLVKNWTLTELAPLVEKGLAK